MSLTCEQSQLTSVKDPYCQIGIKSEKPEQTGSKWLPQQEDISKDQTSNNPKEDFIFVGMFTSQRTEKTNSLNEEGSSTYCKRDVEENPLKGIRFQ